MPRLAEWIQRLRPQRPHPWRAAARWSSSNRREAEARLRHWRQWGIPAAELQALAAMPCDAEPSITWPAFTVTLGASPQQLQNWQWHAWVQHLPLPNQRSVHLELTPPSSGVVRLNLEPLPSGAAAQELLGWCSASAVFDIDPARVACLQALGVPANLITAGHTTNGWLDDPTLLREASCRLGLPQPNSLEGGSCIVLGTTGSTWERSLRPPVWAWPGFDQVQLGDAQEARCLAAWLRRCQLHNIQVVRLQPTQVERDQQGFQAITTAAETTAQPNRLPPQAFVHPIDAPTLQQELAWRQAGATAPPVCVTPQPVANVVWESNNPRPATAAICISLFNYADRIETALNSAHAQIHRDLELVVVDDASTDQGLVQVQTWLSHNAERFNRVLLIQHQQNAGLAAARNTAFAHAHAEWCFVLDADNALRPRAVSDCLAIALAAPQETAVVHPLVEVIHENGWNDQRSLISGHTWQQQILKRYNVIDAMAFIRRSAWASVGGYEHIPHGWEDYDFWCKLIESGFHGVLCPQRLATYHSHDASMMHHSTLPHLRHISRILQQRHPWLDLPYAKGMQEGWIQ